VKTKLMGLLFFASLAIAATADKPTVYNHVGDEITPIDLLVKAALEPAFTVVDIKDGAGYVSPKVTEAQFPHLASTPEGEPLGGDVLVAYVVSAKGRVMSPIVLETADKRLDSMALEAMEGWRFTPATVDGVAVAAAAAQQFSFETTPVDFVTQALEPTGGKMARPRGWFYAEGHRGPTLMWTLSREDTSGGRPYTTGVRIQVFSGVKEGTGKTAKEFILDFAESRKKSASKVLKTCDATDQGLFTRTCLETEEGSDHISYSLFWGSKDLDIAAVIMAGTTTELWETYAPAFERMRECELIDMKRFDK